MAEPSKEVYICRTCNSMFFSAADVNEHKAMTGHAYYSKREKEDGNRR